MKKFITNPVYHDLKMLKLIDDRNIVLINKQTRDKNIRVLQDKKTRVIFLEKFTRFSNYYKKEKGSTRYKQKSMTHLKDGTILKTSKVSYKNKKVSAKDNIVGDDLRRFDKFKNYLSGKKICDFGCGYSGFLSLAQTKTKKLFGVELNNFFLDYLNKNKKYIMINNDINKFDNNFDIVTMFHVLEHLPNQLDILKDIRSKLKTNGKLIIEVPHSKDFLLEKIDLLEYKNFIFWSEHLVLHTKNSLISFLKKAGFKKIKISFTQRYGFTNHLNWFLNKKPGGHDKFNNIYNEKFDQNYKNHLENNELTDTLIAIGEK
jgi:2-polyprenyl-3-methyl-5-hydroxy-6-metoxy-1,4-benzoquinol methylase